MTEPRPSLNDPEVNMLMPQSSPRPAARRPTSHLQVGARRYISDQSEHEYAALADQLDALEDDIHHARESSTEAQRAPGMTPHVEAEAPRPSPRGESVVLADGASILIRPVEPDDARQLNAGFEHLSAVSRYRRFLTTIDHLSKQQLMYLTDVDHELHEALVALDAVTGEGVGIARSVRDTADPGRAEVTVVVADLWQSRGVGSSLIERLATRAQAAGVERFTARMLIGNHAGHRLLERVASKIDEHANAATIELSARLRTFPHETPPAPDRDVTAGPVL
jgi:GNAT superfamily N-acetyltransferase